MRSLKLLFFAALFLLSGAILKGVFDADNPPNPIDAKKFSLTIVNKTGDNFNVQYMLDDKTLYTNSISAGGNVTFNIDGRSNKKRAFFYFLKVGGSGKGFQFFYKKTCKAKSAKIDTIYLIKNKNGELSVSATEQPNPITTLLVVNYSEL